MIGVDAVKAILSQYERFGWQLHHLLMADDMRNSLGSAAGEFFGGMEILNSDLNAAWFSRPAENGRIAYELRALDATPFALLDSTSADADEIELRDMFVDVEQQLRDRLSRHPKTH
jgi:hypothetical protein